MANGAIDQLQQNPEMVNQMPDNNQAQMNEYYMQMQ